MSCGKTDFSKYFIQLGNIVKEEDPNAPRGLVLQL